MAVFNFKKFSISDDGATMKVGTDGVLLGAWANVDGTGTLLDIGTGSGLIALMLAQRTGDKATIDAIELQSADAAQAALNVELSPWPHKIKVHHSRIQDYRPAFHYDAIVCNPPYFSNSLRPPRADRTLARHDTALSSKDLIDSVARLLGPGGIFSLILPHNESDSFARDASRKKLFLTRLTRFFTRSGKTQERALMEFRHQPNPLKEDSLILFESAQHWTEKYRNLTSEFYLARHMR